jgi:hypothetical protein
VIYCDISALISPWLSKQLFDSGGKNEFTFWNEPSVSWTSVTSALFEKPGPNRVLLKYKRFNRSSKLLHAFV